MKAFFNSILLPAILALPIYIIFHVAIEKWKPEHQEKRFSFKHLEIFLDDHSTTIQSIKKSEDSVRIKLVIPKTDSLYEWVEQNANTFYDTSRYAGTMHRSSEHSNLYHISNHPGVTLKVNYAPIQADQYYFELSPTSFSEYKLILRKMSLGQTTLFNPIFLAYLFIFWCMFNLVKWFRQRPHDISDNTADIDEEPVTKNMRNSGTAPKVNAQLEEIKGMISADLEKGFLNLVCDDEMKVGKKYEVRIDILKKAALDQIRIKALEQINVSQIMSVTLKGDDFEITSLNKEEKIVLDDKPSTWNWLVRPLKSGNRDLIVDASLKLSVDKLGTSFLAIPSFSRTIVVKVNAPYAAGQFVIKNWQWMCGTTFGSGLLIVILKHYGYLH